MHHDRQKLATIGAGSFAGGRTGWRICYLDLLERVGHHCNEHINEDDDGHRVIAHEHVLGDALSEALDLSFAHGAELRQPEE